MGREDHLPEPPLSYAAPKNESIDVVQSHSRFNARLQALSIPPLTAASHSQFLATGNRHRVARAIEIADSNADARTYVVKTLLEFRPVTDALEGGDTRGEPSPQSNPSRVTNMADHRRPNNPAPASASAPPASGSDASDYPPEESGGYPDDDAPVPEGNRNPNPGRQARDSDNRDSKQREYVNVHVYGGKAALCFSADETKHGVPTVQIDAAPLIGERTYNWSEKVTIQLTVGEMPHVAAVIFGVLPGCDYGNHGPDHKKGFKMENQPGKVFVQLRAPGVSHAVPITAVDIWKVGNLFARQLRAGNRHLTTFSDVLAMLRATTVRMLAPARPG